MFLNKPRALQFMRDHQLDALVATSPINITYFTGYYCWLDSLFKGYMMTPGGSSETAQRYAVVTADGRTALVVGALMAVNANDLGVSDLVLVGDPGVDTSLSPAELSTETTERQRSLFSTLLSANVSPSPTAALQRILGDYGLADGRIGVEMEGLTASSKAELAPAITESFPQAMLMDCSNTIRLIRMVKTGEEIDRLARATEIAEAAAAEALALASPGTSTGELLARFRLGVAERGADLDHFAFGLYGLGIATEPDVRLTAQFVEYVDFGCRYGYTISDSGLTLALQSLESPLAERYEAVTRSVDAGAAALRPGVKASGVQAAMQQSFRDDGITATFPHGHGVGLELRDYPILVPDTGLRIRDDCVDVPADLALEENVVVNLEAPVFMPGVGSLHVEKTYVVTSSGCRPLVHQARERPFIPSDELNVER